MSATHQRFTSPERRLWWDIDRDAASITGCMVPCEYTIYEVERVPYEHEYEYNGEKDYRYSIQVAEIFVNCTLLNSLFICFKGVLH